MTDRQEWNHVSSSPLVAGPGDTTTSEREIYVDFLRAFSLLVVVIWHWVFTIFEVVPGGTFRPSSPLAFSQNAWVFTWMLQVMPVFFFVGGFVHSNVWARVRSQGGGWTQFVVGRVRRLLLPALVLVGLTVVLGAVVVVYESRTWGFAVGIALLSPLWFLLVYLMLVVLAPAAIWAHSRWGELVLVFLGGLVAAVDLLRFAHGVEQFSMLNMILVWGFVHQLGFFYPRLVASSRRVAWTLFWAGLFGLIILTNTGIYPRSMVGVPTDHISNMGPPTMAIVCLALFQAGLVTLLRRSVLERLQTRARWSRFNQVANRYAMPIYLFHTSGYGIAYGLLILVFSYYQPTAPTMEWWVTRPLWIALPILFTIPVIAAYGRLFEAVAARVSGREP